MFNKDFDFYLTKAKRVTFIIICLFWGTVMFVYGTILIAKKYIYPLEYKEIVIVYADEYNIDRALIFSIIKTESSFNKNVVSSKGAVGLMQITESTANYISKMLGEDSYNLKDAKTNIRYGCKYLRYLMDKFSNTQVALCAYNAGEGNVMGWLKNDKYSPDGKRLNNIPFDETKNYLEKIQKSFANYKKLYGKIVDN